MERQTLASMAKTTSVPLHAVHILLVAFYYPPDPAIGAVRPSALVQHLSREGHRVHILASQVPGLPSAPHVSRVDWRDPRNGFRWFSEAAAEEVSDTREGAVKPAGSLSVQGPTTPPSIRSAFRRLLRARAKGLIEQPDRSFTWVRPAIRQGRDIIRKQSIDAIVATGPPFTTFLVASRLADEFSIPWAADYRDLWTRGHYYPFGSFRRKLDWRIERRVVPTAELVTTVSPPLTDQLAVALKRSVLTIPNGVDRWKSRPIQKRRPLSNAKVTIAYVGTEFYEGRRSPKHLFDAAYQLGLTREDICFTFIGLQGHASERLIRKRAQQANVANLVQVTPPVSRDECMHLQSNADALLLLLWDHPEERAVLTGKLFEYIAVKRPIIVAGCSNGLAAKAIKDHNLGYVVADLESAKTALTDLLDSKASHDGLAPDVESGAISAFGRSAYLTEWTAALTELRYESQQL